MFLKRYSFSQKKENEVQHSIQAHDSEKDYVTLFSIIIIKNNLIKNLPYTVFSNVTFNECILWLSISLSLNHVQLSCFSLK